MRGVLRPGWARGGRAPVGRPGVRPTVERLEDRLTPATFSVVGSGGNGTTTFNTFAAAYSASTSPTDVIQIEPSAGNVGAISLNNPAKALTVMGDENFATSSTALAVGDVTVAVSGVRLTHLYVNGTVTVSAGFRGTDVSDVQLGGFTETAGAGNGGNLLQRDHVRGNVILQGGDTTATASGGDRVLDCDFDPGAQLQIGQAGAAATRVVVSDTTFEPSTTTGLVITDSSDVRVEDVRISLTSAGDAVVINNTLATLPVTDLRFMQDDPRSEGGTGVHINVTTAGEQLGLSVEGTAFQGNKTAINLTGTGALAPGSFLDAGGGDESAGGNEFRSGVTTGILINDPAILTGQLTVWANNNSVGPGVTVVAQTAGTATVNATQQLTQQQAFVESLYHNFLSHTGSPDELNFWVTQLPTLGAQGVTAAIIHSPEASTRLLLQLYSQLLGRDLDPLGATYFTRQLLSGATEEQILQQILVSPEFANHANSLVGTSGSSGDLNFVQALYDRLLGRTGEGSAGDNFWLNVLSTQGRAAVVNGFLQSAEFRSKFVEAMYTDYTGVSQDNVLGTAPDLLCRSVPPTASDTSFWWSNNTLDLFSIIEGITASNEYFAVR